jgi:hypothetical protein
MMQFQLCNLFYQELQDHQGITQFGDTDVNHGEIANENGRYTGRHYFTKHPMKEKKGVCVVCSAAAYGTQTRPTRTTYWCPDCKVRLCHRGMCFQRYHSEPIEHLDFGRKRQRGIRSWFAKAGDPFRQSVSSAESFQLVQMRRRHSIKLSSTKLYAKDSVQEECL